MVQVANPSHVKAARLRESGVEWTAALKEAKVPDTDLTRNSVRRIIRELVSMADAEAEAETERDDAAAELRAKRKDLKAGGAEAGRCRRRRRGRAGSAGGVTMTPTRASRGARRGRRGASGAGAAAARAMATRRRRFGATSGARGAASGW